MDQGISSQKQSLKETLGEENQTWQQDVSTVGWGAFTRTTQQHRHSFMKGLFVISWKIFWYIHTFHGSTSEPESCFHISIIIIICRFGISLCYWPQTNEQSQSNSKHIKLKFASLQPLCRTWPIRCHWFPSHCFHRKNSQLAQSNIDRTVHFKVTMH